MIMNNSIGQEDGSRLQAKQEEPSNEGRNTSRTLPCTSRQWSSFRNPRIVRVSRSFGGKDRHSKVCTVRGLRDRRIRLSIPTAVQLYDLQDKLGLNQPSKVVDWLLDATKEDIDKLPPLQMPPGFSQFHQQQVFGSSGSRNLMGDLLLPYESNPYESPLFPTNTCSLLTKHGLSINDGYDKYDDGKFWDMGSGLRMKSKEVMNDQKGKSIELQKVSAQSLFPTNAMPYSYNHFENPSLSLSQFGVQPQAETFFNPNSMSLPSSSLDLPSGSHVYFCPTTLPSLFPSYPPYLTPLNEDDTRQVNHFQLLNNAAGPSQPSAMPASRFFQANVINSKYLHHLHDNEPSQSDKRVDNS